MMEQARIQDGGHRQSPTPSRFLQTPHTHAAEPDSWTLLGKMLSAEAGQWESLEKAGREPGGCCSGPGSWPFLEKKQAWQLGLLSAQLCTEGGGRCSCCLRSCPTSVPHCLLRWPERKPGGLHLKGP